MSRYCLVKTMFTDTNALVVALMETGNWTVEQIEVHEVPQHLRGIGGDKRKEKANIIIRRQHVGRASNDLGFVKGEDGSYETIVSQFDLSRYGATWMANLKGNYAYHKLKQDQEEMGRTVSRERCPGTNRQRVEITGYR